MNEASSMIIIVMQTNEIQDFVCEVACLFLTDNQPEINCNDLR